jgi:hypothetical protein
MTYTDFVESLYTDIKAGKCVRDHYAQVIIEPKLVIEQMTHHNATAMRDAVENCMTEAAGAIKAVRELHREAFYQLAAMHESELRRVYEVRYL